MTKSTYLTARCTRGCERWGTPEVMERHVRERRCGGVAWFRRPVETTLIEPKYVKMLMGTKAEDLLVLPPPEDSGRSDGHRSYQPYAVYSGGRLRSPLDGVPPRVWWLVVKRHLDAGAGVESVFDAAVDEDSYPSVVPDGFLEQFVDCPMCGEVVVHLAAHQRSNTRCRTAAAANRIVDLWTLGYRDPWTAIDHPPLTWAELQVARWKRRLIVVEFPQQVAVLIDRI